MPVLRYFSSNAQPTTLSGSISSGATSITLAATTGFPGAFPYTVAVDYGSTTEELVDVTNAAGTTLTVTRGVDGTSAQSHSLGAVVRHVSSGRDFADYQTHQAATSGVHGVSGTLVGTSDAQTLANKTLTSPAISGATLSGTLSGTPTFSGAVAHTGAPLFRGALATDIAYSARVTGDANPRLITGADGKHTWGNGTAVGDTTLARSGAGALLTNASWSTARSTLTDVAFGVSVTGEANDRLQVNARGELWWGNGTLTQDTVLSRSGAGFLRTDGNFTAGGKLDASNFPSGASTPWTPIWGTSSGLHLPSIGNGAITARYLLFGKCLLWWMEITFGSTTNFGSGATTTDNWTFPLPAGMQAAVSPSVQVGTGRATQTANATCPLVAFVDSGGTNILFSTAGGRQDGAAIVNTGTLDSLSPWTWANGNNVIAYGQLEIL